MGSENFIPIKIGKPGGAIRRVLLIDETPNDHRTKFVAGLPIFTGLAFTSPKSFITVMTRCEFAVMEFSPLTVSFNAYENSDEICGARHPKIRKIIQNARTKERPIKTINPESDE